jgi:ureidoacrylate peracid hydrolase
MLQALGAARKAELRVFYALHRRYRPGDYETWKYIAPVQKAAWLRKSFEYRHVGVARSAASSSLNRAKSWPSSIGVPVVSPIRIGICSFKKHGIHKLIVMGLIAYNCSLCR